MPHLLIAGKLHPAGLAWLETARDFSYDYVEEISESSYAPLIGRADALVIRTQPLPAPSIAEAGAAAARVAPRRRLRFGRRRRAERAPHSALHRRRHQFAVGRRARDDADPRLRQQAIRADRAARSGAWGWRNRLEAAEVSGKRLLILGSGRSGRRLAGMAQGFEMEVRVFDPFLVERGWPEGPAAPVASLARRARLGRYRLRACAEGGPAVDRR